MKTLLPILVLICAGACSAQEIVGKSAPVSLMPQPAPLKCGKWEHVEQTHIVADPNAHGYIEGFRVDKTPRCAPNLRTVTEKEWQEREAEFKALDRRIRELEEVTAGLKYVRQLCASKNPPSYCPK